MKHSLASQCTAEFVGTFALMFAGGAAIIVSGGDNVVAIALAHGLILGVMISALMHITGGQFNPAVSIALLVMGKQKPALAFAFVASQVGGAVVAAVLLKTFLAGAYDVGNVGATLGALSTGESANPMAVLGIEIVATFFLMFVIVGTAVDDRGVGKNAAVGGFGIGLTLAACILAIGPATGASLNPARSFGPALVAGAWEMHWVYWIAPIIGAAIAGLVWKHLIGLDAVEDENDF